MKLERFKTVAGKCLPCTFLSWTSVIVEIDLYFIYTVHAYLDAVIILVVKAQTLYSSMAQKQLSHWCSGGYFTR